MSNDYNDKDYDICSQEYVSYDVTEGDLGMEKKEKTRLAQILILVAVITLGGSWHTLGAQTDAAGEATVKLAESQNPASGYWQGDEYHVGDLRFKINEGILSDVYVVRYTDSYIWDEPLHCSDIAELTIPDVVTSIGDEAFWACSNLTSIKIPGSVTSIGDSAFNGCNSLKSIEIPGSVTSIGRYAFSGCSSLTSIKLAEGVTSIGDSAFNGCNSLKSIEIPGSVTSIGGSNPLFCDCSSLTSIKLTEGVKNIEDSAFWGCSSLKSIEIPGSVTRISGKAFKDCDRLTIKLAEGVKNIGLAFQGISGLTSIEIPGSVTRISEAAFSGCDKLAAIEVASDNSNYSSIDGVLVDRKRMELLVYPKGKKGAKYQIPEQVARISDAAFSGCSSLTSIEITEGVTKIGRAFSGMERLTSITIPGSVKRIEDAAFSGCSRLKSIKIAKGVTSIGKEVFDGCSSLKSITIPGSVKTIKKGTFFYSSLTSVKIEEGVTSIGEEAFSRDDSGYYGIQSLVSITIPKSVKNIGKRAFYRCASLTSVKIAEGVTSIGEYAFEECSSLTSITIPKSVKKISDYAFVHCSSLKNVTLPENMKSIGDGAFGNCPLTSITIPENVTSIGNWAFGNCSLKSIIIPENVTSIGNGAFENCPLTSITIPDGVKEIFDHTFQGCINLTSIIIPDSVTDIGKLAFDDCKAPVIYCNKGSAAESYAIFHNIPFKPISEAPKGDENAKKHTITAKNITKTYGAKAFSLGAKANGGKLTYTISDKKVAAVSNAGKVTIKGCGVTKITIKAAANKKYKAAEKTITLTVKPRQQKLSSVKSQKAKSIAVKWKKDAKADGYLIQYSTDKNFKKNVKTVTVKKNSTTSKTISKLKGGKKYYVRICSYKQSGKGTIRGAYSPVKAAIAKK